MSALYRVVLCLGAGQKAEELLSGDMATVAPWLETLPCTPDARTAIADYDHVEEVWVSSGDGIEAVNLGAALKRDDPCRAVFLVGCEDTGSVRSRAHAAALDGVLSSREVALRCRAIAERAKEREAEGATASKEAEPKMRDAGGEDHPQALGEGALSAVSEGIGLVAPPSDGETAAPPHGGFLFTVVSGSGGAGKSTVAVLAALLAARRGLRTALLDADLQFGDACDLAGSCTCISLEEVVSDQRVLDDLPLDGPMFVRPPRRLEMAEAMGMRLGDAVDALLGRFEFVAVNTGGVWDEQKMHLLERSVTTLFLVDQRLSSLRSCRHALDLCLRCGVATSSFLVAVNKCSRHAPFTSIDVSSALHGAHVVELSDGGPEVEELLGAGMADALMETRNSLCSSLDRLLDEVMPGTSGGAGARTSSHAGSGVRPGDIAVRGQSRRRGRSHGQRRRHRRRAETAVSDGNVG